MNSVNTHFTTGKKPLSYAPSHSDIPPMKNTGDWEYFPFALTDVQN